MLKNKPRILTSKWLNYNANGIPSLTRYLLFKWGHWLGGNGTLKFEMGVCENTLMDLGTFELLNFDEFLPVEAASSLLVAVPSPSLHSLQ